MLNLTLPSMSKLVSMTTAANTCQVQDMEERKRQRNGERERKSERDGERVRGMERE